MEKIKPEINTFGGSPVAEHNMPCPVCWERSAVLKLNGMVFLPCWSCQRQGWRTLKLPKWARWLLRKVVR